MTNPDELSSIIDRIATGKQTEADIDVLRQMLSEGDRQIATQLGKYNVNIGQGQGVQIGDHSYIEINDEVMRALIRAIQKPPNVLSKFQSLIQDKTKDFVGRERVFAEIENFIANHRNGYFIIEGDPGIGKSTLIAEYVRRNKCIAHFNGLSNGNTQVKQFLESVCCQLIARYKLSYEFLPSNTTTDGVFLSELLREAKALAPNEKLVIAVDALDEVNPIDYISNLVNILYLPSELPEGVYFVMTSQRVEMKLSVRVPLNLFNLMEEREQNLEDTRKYIEQEITKNDESKGMLLRPKLQKWVTQQKLSNVDFVNQFNNKTEGNFLYVFFILNGIEDGLYTNYNFEKLPTNLNKYYEDLCDRIGMFAGEKRYAKARIVYILSETNNAIPYPEIVAIIKYTGEPDAELIVNDVLKIWIRVLREDFLYEEYFYSPYHNSYRNFLHADKTVQRAGIRIKEIKKLMADSMDLY
jgi:hypothetical protein